jgi:aspartate racemase
MAGSTAQLEELMHVGMIGGIGPAATEFYYRNLVSVYRGGSSQLDLTIVHADVNTLVANIASGAPAAQARVYLELALRLQAAGADAIVISSIAGHFCVPQFEKITPLPILSIIPDLDLEFHSRQLTRVGLLGNQVTMQSKLFGGIESAEILIPQGKDFDRVHDEYLQMATTGKVTEQQREQLFAIGKRLCTDQGAEVVLLAGTDLFLAFEGYDCGFVTMDGALVHINAIQRKSVEFDGNQRS